MKGVYPVRGSGRATLWVEKSGWCCLQPALDTAILTSVINLSLEAENMAMVPTCGPLPHSSHVELHVYMERNYLTW